MTESPYRLLGTCEVHPTARICDGAIIGKLFRPLLDDDVVVQGHSTTVLAEGVYVGYYSLIGAGTELRNGVIVDDQCSVECDVIIGEHTLVIYRAQICSEARVGSGCVVGGFVAERTTIGDHARVFGEFAHSQYHPNSGWDSDKSIEPSAVVGARAFVGFGAKVIGPVNLGEGCYVCAGAIITKDVPPGFIARRVNELVEPEEWSGTLSQSDYFRRSSKGE